MSGKFESDICEHVNSLYLATALPDLLPSRWIFNQQKGRVERQRPRKKDAEQIRDINSIPHLKRDGEWVRIVHIGEMAERVYREWIHYDRAGSDVEQFVKDFKMDHECSKQDDIRLIIRHIKQALKDKYEAPLSRPWKPISLEEAQVLHSGVQARSDQSLSRLGGPSQRLNGQGRTRYAHPSSNLLLSSQTSNNGQNSTPNHDILTEHRSAGHSQHSRVQPTHESIVRLGNSSDAHARTFTTAALTPGHRESKKVRPTQTTNDPKYNQHATPKAHLNVFAMGARTQSRKTKKGKDGAGGIAGELIAPALGETYQSAKATTRNCPTTKVETPKGSSTATASRPSKPRAKVTNGTGNQNGSGPVEDHARKITYSQSFTVHGENHNPNRVLSRPARTTLNDEQRVPRNLAKPISNKPLGPTSRSSLNCANNGNHTRDKGKSREGTLFA